MQQRENNIPMIVLTKAIAYFLAGSFIIKTVIPLQSPDGTLQPLNLFSVVVGSILILAGFVFILTILPFRWLTGLVGRFRQWSFWLLPMLFAVIASQVVKVLFDFREITPLFITTIIFLIFVLVAIVFTSRQVFQNVRSLLSLSLTFNIIAVVVLLVGAEKIQIITILVFSTALLLWTIIRISRQRERQQDRL